jgi:Xaa-Pro aminopeptidase
MRANEIDKIGRDIITKAGFGKYFVHSTGHGVGLDIHEMPYISSNSKTTIEDGMVFTIEPGIYIPNKFGIRIEDMVAMVGGRAIIL